MIPELSCYSTEALLKELAERDLSEVDPDSVSYDLIEQIITFHRAGLI